MHLVYGSGRWCSLFYHHGFVLSTMTPITTTMSKLGFKAGVKEYRLTYYTPDYECQPTDILAAFRYVAQAGVPAEEAGAAVA